MTKYLYLVDRVYEMSGWSVSYMEHLRDELVQAIDILDEEIENEG